MCPCAVLSTSRLQEKRQQQQHEWEANTQKEGKWDCGLLLTWLELAIDVADMESQNGGQSHVRATAALQIPSHQSSHEIVLGREQG